MIRGLTLIHDTRVATYTIAAMTAIIGRNGSGKTHFLEAIHLAAGGEIPYIYARPDEDRSFEITLETPVGTKKFQRTQQGKRKEIYSIQGKKVTRAIYRKELPITPLLISPFDMNLLYFAPQYRREMIDSILDRAYTNFLPVKRAYQASMQQRNSLLKMIREGSAKSSDLDFWDGEFAKQAQYYDLYRRKWVSFIERNSHVFRDALKSYDISFEYENSTPPTDDTETWIREELKRTRERDIQSGHTHIWPHRDDFRFIIRHQDGESESQFFLSRWENKTLLLALKKLELQFLQETTKKPVFLLFDDVFAELDDRNSAGIIKSFSGVPSCITNQYPLPEWPPWDAYTCINLNRD